MISIKPATRSIANTLLVGIISSLIVTALVVLSIDFLISSKKAEKELQKSLKKYADALTDVLLVPLWNYDIDTVESIGRAYSLNQSIIELIIKDHKGKVLFHSNRQRDFPETLSSHDILYDGRKIGLVQISLNLDFYKDIQTGLFLSHSIMIFVMIFILLLVIVGLLQRYIRRPINHFIAMTNAFAIENQNAFDEPVAYAEFQPLIRVLKTMGEKIAHQMQSIRKMNEDLEERVYLRTSELQEANMQLEAAKEAALEAKHAAEASSLAKSTFLANMSHEIRTPMNSVLGFIDLVMEDDKLNKTHRTYLTTAKKSGKSLLSLINDILDVSKLASDRLKLENISFNLKKTVEDTIGTLTPGAMEKGLFLKVQIQKTVPCNLMGDPGRLRQILINLTGNAIKFTGKGGVIVRVTQQSSDIIHFSISDTGIGIPENRLQSIFEPFAQADASTTRKFGGTGLGTTISKQLVELMGGKIWAESKSGEGSIFHFTVRMAEAEIDEQSLADSEHAPTVKRCFKVLLAEDIDENIMLARIRMEDLGHTVIEARTGLEAVEAFKREKPDIILMDIHMPEMGGVEAAKIIRRMKTDAGIPTPIIALTASLMKEEQQIYVKAEIDAVVGKPVDFNKLFETMERLVPEGKGKVLPVSGKRQPLDHVNSAWEKPLNSVNVPEIPKSIINWEKGFRTWGNADVYKKALQQFCLNYGNAADETLNFVKSGNREGAYQITHLLKGLSGNLSMTEVYQIATEINNMVKKMEIDELIPRIKPLSDALNRVVSYIPQTETTGKEKQEVSLAITNLPALTELFREMMVTFDEYNPLKVEPYIEKLPKYISPSRLDPIKQELDRFDFDGAKKETLRLAASLGIDIENC
ncbi:ATP-binding protein [Desulfonema limicola]|nr:ATP-binding protein [Desulfonema limicola]